MAEASSCWAQPPKQKQVQVTSRDTFLNSTSSATLPLLTLVTQLVTLTKRGNLHNSVVDDPELELAMSQGGY